MIDLTARRPPRVRGGSCGPADGGRDGGADGDDFGDGGQHFAVAVLTVGGVDIGGEQPTAGFGQAMPQAPVDPLAGVMAPGAPPGSAALAVWL